MKPKPLIRDIVISAERERAPVPRDAPSCGSNHQHSLSFQNILKDVVTLNAVLFHALLVVTAESVSVVYRINVLDIRILHPKTSCFTQDSAD